MKSINIIQASKLVLKGTPDITSHEKKSGVLIGKNLYYERGTDEDGYDFAFSGDIYLIDEKYDLEIPWL